LQSIEAKAQSGYFCSKKRYFTFKYPQITNVTGQFQKAMIGSEQLAYVENDLVKVAFTNKGGQIKWVELKKFKDQEKKLVKLASTDFDKIDYKIKGDSDRLETLLIFILHG
jgi:hypothetical protein